MKNEFTNRKLAIAKRARGRRIPAKRSAQDDENRVKFLAELQARRLERAHER